ncbi:hypothetical protein ACFU5O_26575 [Streptomyces sp. NPDC057445]|uniref:hypothetical protein n=1 Tax=Streptomyces sp. NPDC057445 TaxID=3346136 RepID=UPI00369E6D83
MQCIEFFTYASALQWGVRVDGTDLRVHAADATREPWRLENQDDTTPEEREEFLFSQHAGLTQDELGDPARHFLGEGGPGLLRATTGAVAVLGCSCGIWECWPLLTHITVTPETVEWSGFRQPYRPTWGELPMGPYVFPRAAYENALAHPVHLAGDPLTALPHRTQQAAGDGRAIRGDRQDGTDRSLSEWPR